MPAVKSRRKSSGGKPVKCRTCGHEIQPGETYYSFAFYRQAKQVRCKNHFPRRSELTQSHVGNVLAELEAAVDGLPECTTVDEVEQLLSGVSSAAQDAAGEYELAAENFGGGGPNAERAQGLQDFADEVDSFDVPDPADFEAEEGAVESDDGVAKVDGVLVDLGAWREAVSDELSQLDPEEHVQV